MEEPQFMNIGLPRQDWVILQLNSGKLIDLGYVTLQEQIVIKRPGQQALTGENRVVVLNQGNDVISYKWSGREVDSTGRFTGVARSGDTTIFVGAAAYELAKRSRKLLKF